MTGTTRRPFARAPWSAWLFKKRLALNAATWRRISSTLPSQLSAACLAAGGLRAGRGQGRLDLVDERLRRCRRCRHCPSTSTSGIRVETTGKPAARYSRTLSGLAFSVTSLMGNGLMRHVEALAVAREGREGFAAEQVHVGQRGQARRSVVTLPSSTSEPRREVLRDVHQEIDVDPVVGHQPEVAEDRAGQLRDLGRDRVSGARAFWKWA